LNGGNGSGADTLLGGAGSDTFYYSGTGSTYVGGGADDTIIYPANPGDVIALQGSSLLVNDRSKNLGSVSGIQNILVTGSPASVNNSQQRLWPVDDIPLTNAVISGVTVASGSPLAVLTGGFTDANPSASAGTETATIDWGDGTRSAGIITATGGGNYTITASHIFATNGAHLITATVIDSLGAATTTATTFTGGLALNGGVLDSYVGSTPTVIDSGVKDPPVVRNADATVFSLHNNGDLVAISGSSSKQVDANVQKIRLGPDGTLYALHAGSLYSAASGSSTPSFYANNVQDLVQDASGNLYELTNGSLYVLQAGSVWALVQSGVESIQPAAGGAAVNVVQANGNSWQYIGTAGLFLGGPQFSFNLPAAATAGQPLTVTLQVLDDFGNPVTGYTGTVNLGDSDQAAAATPGDGPPPQHTFTAADHGAFSFPTTFVTSGIQTLTATGNGGLCRATPHPGGGRPFQLRDLPRKMAPIS
jgi:hypothetical protein